MEKNENIDIKRLVDIILSKKLFIIILVIISLTLGYGYSYYYKTPLYNSSVTVLLTGDETQGMKEVTQTDLTINSGLISTYRNIAKSSNVIKATIDNLGLDISVEELQKDIIVEEIKNTQFIKITVENKEPEMAMKIANEFAKVFSNQIKEIYNLENITIVDEAEAENTPCNVNHKKDMVMFFTFGLFLSGVLILVFYIFDDTIKDEEDIKMLNLENIGVIPNAENQNEKLTIKSNPKSYIVECLKTTRTNILYSTNKNSQTILITSIREKEGKSWIINNLAVAFAQANKRVVLVDANLRKQSDINEIFDIEKGEGLSDFIKEITDDKLKNLKKATKYIKETQIPNLHILQNGTIPPNPSELVTSNNMERLLELLKSMYDIVLIDGNSCSMVSDSIALSSMVDNTILVVENKKTKISEINKIKKLIKDVNGNLIGAILNRKNLQDKKYYGKGYGYYYGDKSKDTEKIETEQNNITVSEIIKLSEQKIKEEILENKKTELDESIEIKENQEKIANRENNLSKIESKELDNKLTNFVDKIFNRILKIERKIDEDNTVEKMDNISISIEAENNKQKEELKIINERINNANEELKKLNELQNSKIDEINNKIEELTKINTDEINNKIEELTKINTDEINNKIEELTKINTDEINNKIEELTRINADEINNKIEELTRINADETNNKIEELTKINIDSNKELLEKIENMNINIEKQNVIVEKENTDTEGKGNIISFESLKERKRRKDKAIKKGFSINESIMYEDLELVSSCIVELNGETKKIMVN